MSEGIKRMIKVEKIVNVDDAIVEMVLNILGETYETLGPPMTFSATLRIFEKSDGSQFFASHEVVEGKPTISIYVDKMSSLPYDVAVGGIRRQAAHSILHGSREFYSIKLPSELKRAMTEYSLPENFAMKILYGVSMAIKEYAVTKFLLNGGFIDDQLAYAKYLLEPIPEEAASWEFVKASPLERIVYLVMAARDVSSVMPLTEDPRFSGEIKMFIEKKIEHLPPNYRAKVRKVAGEVSSSFNGDVFRNIDRLTNIIVRELIDEELAFYRKTTQPL
ncbi:MAG: hypothetical protein N3F10_06120 [Candidatus Bathyarchaeota archaeon]|nr:hypothetical protein [Candidatus Bathyarchaeota archaeon]MCX8177852.1 hypothetical protein [Candidatus Bathyarchaeota archaeon]MDW8193610.1 hypothetical protein [Nitrososphaerota archaeon]